MQYEKYKGIHPGIVLDRELKKRAIKQRPFALSLHEHPQTFNAITKGKRGISTQLALKIEKELEMEEGVLAVLQVYYDIRKIREKQEHAMPDFSVINKSLFWDTDIEGIDWQRQYRAVIQRIFERGKESDKKEITRFYGPEKIKQALEASSTRVPYTLYKLKQKH